MTAYIAYIVIHLGAVPVATLNLQQGVLPGDVIPDEWHHQMVFGVGPAGIYNNFKSFL